MQRGYRKQGVMRKVKVRMQGLMRKFSRGKELKSRIFLRGYREEDEVNDCVSMRVRHLR